MKSPKARLLLLAVLSAVAIGGSFLLSPRYVSASADASVAPSFKPRVFPNPWKVDKHSAQGVTFDQFPAGSTVKIYTIAAEPVRSLVTDSTQVLWDLKNDDTDNVASGVYLYTVKSPSHEVVRGKLVVIR